MSFRPELAPISVITNGSMGGNITSLVTIVQKISMPSYEVVWSAGSTPIGTLAVQVSNSYSLNQDGSVRNAGTWTAVELSSGGSTVTSIAVTGNTGNAFIDLHQLGAYAMRLVYTRTSGSGTLNAILCGKVA